MNEQVIRQMLQDEIDVWEGFRHPALLQRFILRNGEYFQGEKLPKAIRKARPKECFKNAGQLALLWEADYYEGYVLSPEMPLPILHAWAVINGNLIDNTLKNPEKYHYIGVKFAREICAQQWRDNGVWGLLDTGAGLNADLMFDHDPELREALARFLTRDSSCN